MHIDPGVFFALAILAIIFGWAIRSIWRQRKEELERDGAYKETRKTTPVLDAGQVNAKRLAAFTAPNREFRPNTRRVVRTRTTRQQSRTERRGNGYDATDLLVAGAAGYALGSSTSGSSGGSDSPPFSGRGGDSDGGGATGSWGGSSSGGESSGSSSSSSDSGSSGGDLGSSSDSGGSFDP